ncbi:CAAX amino terminal protease self- immunity [bacterium BMS3Bbin02]|nr:CAAX amino terminal protease self- immunity [bacterium BMS3Bbin02]
MFDGRSPRLATDHNFLKGTMWSLPITFGAIVGGFLAAVVAYAVVGGWRDETLAVAVAGAVQLFAGLAIIFVFAREWAGDGFARAVGLRIKVSDWWMFFVGFGLQIVIVLAVLDPLIRLLNIEQPEQQQIAEIIAAASGVVGVVALMVVTTVLAPIIEEIIYRAVLLRAILRLGVRDSTAIVLSAAVFASIHLVDPQAALVVPGLFVLGVVLSYVTLKSGDLSRAILIHAGVNSLAAIALVVSNTSVA